MMPHILPSIRHIVVNFQLPISALKCYMEERVENEAEGKIEENWKLNVTGNNDCCKVVVQRGIFRFLRQKKDF